MLEQLHTECIGSEDFDELNGEIFYLICHIVHKISEIRGIESVLNTEIKSSNSFYSPSTLRETEFTPPEYWIEVLEGLHIVFDKLDGKVDFISAIRNG
jgi:hypothetical protein